MAVLRRLRIGEKIRVGDWCCDPRCSKSGEPLQPIKVLFRDKYSIISKTHHPHYRIVQKLRKNRKVL